MTSKQKSNLWLTDAAQRTTRAHFGLVAAYMGSIIIFDAWNLITHEAVNQRWTAAGLLLVLSSVAWFFSHMRSLSAAGYRGLLLALALADVSFAMLNVYWERGMASKSVILFVVPIAVIAMLRSRTLLLSATTICAAAYSTTIVRYFNDNYGEGYRVELWGNIFLYSSLFYVFAWLFFTLLRTGQPSK